MIKIRLSMVGRKKAPFYRIVVAHERSRREGKPLEVLGHWNPAKEDLELDKTKLEAWVKKGAQVAVGVKKLLK